MKKLSILKVLVITMAVSLGYQAQAFQLLWYGGGAWFTYGSSYCHVVNMAQYNRLATRATQLGNRPWLPARLTYTGNCKNR